MKAILGVFTALAVMLLLIPAVNAQVFEAGKIRIGIRGGLSAANLLFAEAPNKFAGNCPEGEYGGCYGNGNTDQYTFDYKGGPGNTRFGLVGGLFVERIIDDKLSVELALSYEQKGIKLEFEEYTVQQGNARIENWKYFKRDIRNDYLIMPLVAKYKFSQSSRVYVSAGVYTAFLLNSSGRAEDSAQTVVTHQNYQSSRMMRFDQPADTEWTSFFDAGLVVGGGVTWPLGNELALQLDARLNAGVLKVDRKYNNRFETYPLNPHTGFEYTVISESYYRGLSSQSRNINLALTAGISKSF